MTDLLDDVVGLVASGQQSEARSLLLTCLTIYPSDVSFLTKAFDIALKQEDLKLALRILNLLYVAATADSCVEKYGNLL